jgi:quinoprotein glucose dehydrogenase
LRVLTSTIVVLLAAGAGAAQQGAPQGEWPSFGGDPGNTKYSPLDQIDADNFADLEMAWQWSSISQPIVAANDRIRPGRFSATPLMVDGLLYVSTALSQVAAIDAGSGKTVWSYDPESWRKGRPANLGWQHRGVAYWSDGDDARILIATHDLRLVALNAKTGALYPDFGDGGAVDLSTSLGKPVRMSTLTHSSPPAICRNTVIVGSIVADLPSRKEGPPGHVRGFDVRTGEFKWIFHTIPQEGEVGNETWEGDSWRYTGAANAWTFMAADNELGMVYLSLSTPTNDIYGGHRHGDNLFAESIVALNAETGDRVWHFQAVHHGLWDWDFPTAANLMDIVVDGKPIKALAQVSKQAFTYVFDRETGEPVWPIEERPVPASTVPGEKASATQPFPTKPAPFDRQGVTVDDLIDFTPELRREALEIAAGYELAPMFTPSVTVDAAKPVIQLPGDGGGANWPGAAFDPKTSMLYVPSRTSPVSFVLTQPDPARSNLAWIPRGWSSGVQGPRGLPLLKPPYARTTAIDMSTGEHAWMEPHGAGPREHEALAPLNLPALGGGPFFFSGPLVTDTLLVVNHGRRERPLEAANSLSAYDKATGRYLGSVDLPAAANGNPITYLHEGRQFIAVAVGGGTFMGGGGTPPLLVALALPAPAG